MRSEVREILDKIDIFLSTAPEQARQELWWILTALRGPDSSNIDLKHRATCRLALPRCAEIKTIDPAGLHIPADFNTFDPLLKAEGYPLMGIEPDKAHFLDHYLSALACFPDEGIQNATHRS